MVQRDKQGDVTYPYDRCSHQRWYQGMGTESTNLQLWLRRSRGFWRRRLWVEPGKHARREQTGSSYSTMNNPPPICDCLWSKQNTNLGGGMRGWQKIRLEKNCDLWGGDPWGWGKNVNKEAQRLVLRSTAGSRFGLQVFAWTAVTSTNEKSETVKRRTKGTNEGGTIISERICQECPLGQPLPQLQILWHQMTEQME